MLIITLDGNINQTVTLVELVAHALLINCSSLRLYFYLLKTTEKKTWFQVKNIYQLIRVCIFAHHFQSLFSKFVPHLKIRIYLCKKNNFLFDISVTSWASEWQKNYFQNSTFKYKTLLSLLEMSCHTPICSICMPWNKRCWCHRNCFQPN